MSDPMLDQGEEEEVQSSRQQPGITDSQSQAKRLRVAPAVRYMHDLWHICVLYDAHACYVTYMHVACKWHTPCRKLDNSC